MEFEKKRTMLNTIKKQNKKDTLIRNIALCAMVVSAMSVLIAVNVVHPPITANAQAESIPMSAGKLINISTVCNTSMTSFQDTNEITTALSVENKVSNNKKYIIKRDKLWMNIPEYSETSDPNGPLSGKNKKTETSKPKDVSDETTSDTSYDDYNSYEEEYTEDESSEEKTSENTAPEENVSEEETFENTASEEDVSEEETSQQNTSYSYNESGHLNSFNGRFNGPSGVETYYNLPMEGVVSIMRNIGFSESEYPYWVRDDGCKMLGDYIMVAADLSIRPRGSTVPTSLGTGLVCDTGGFIYNDPYQLDIATDW